MPSTPTAKTLGEKAKDALHVLAEVVVLFGLPATAYQIWAARKDAYKHAFETHEQVYSGLDAQYTDFLKLCLQYPKLDCFDVPADPPPSLDKDELAQQRILYAILIPMLEHAFLAYHGPQAQEIWSLTEAQWPGWQLYASSFMGRQAFRDVWRDLGNEFDHRFKVCMDSLDPTARGGADPCDPAVL